jgi:hypothetical protein
MRVVVKAFGGTQELTVASMAQAPPLILVRRTNEYPAALFSWRIDRRLGARRTVPVMLGAKAR